MNQRRRPWKLNRTQQAQAVRIFSRAISEATYHIRRIRSGAKLCTYCGTKITLKLASERRKRCIKKVKLALKGFII